MRAPSAYDVTEDTDDGVRQLILEFQGEGIPLAPVKTMIRPPVNTFSEVATSPGSALQACSSLHRPDHRGRQADLAEEARFLRAAPSASPTGSPSHAAACRSEFDNLELYEPMPRHSPLLLTRSIDGSIRLLSLRRHCSSLGHHVGARMKAETARSICRESCFGPLQSSW